jgi:hypothetical protein
MAPSELFEIQGNGKTCISIIISLQNKLSEKMQIKKTIKKVEGLLQGIYSADEIRKILSTLDKLVDKLECTVNPPGVGIYITEKFSKLVRFPFVVKEKIHIGESFWVKELICLDYYKVGYYVLQVSGNVINLYKGKLNHLEKVQDKRFPYLMEHYTPAHVGDILIKDKVAVNNNMLKNYLVSADNKLSHYLGENLLVLTGPEKDLMQFHEITNHWTHVVGDIPGNYIDEPLSLLEENVWPLMRDWLDNHKEVLANEWLAKNALHKISDIREIWRAAVSGKALILMVEKDYALPAYQDRLNGGIHIKVPHTTYRIISDIVNEIMRIVLEEGGDVIILKNGSLNNYHHMVLLTE